MIRALVASALVALLVQLLLVPSRHEAADLALLLAQEHRVVIAHFGAAAADRLTWRSMQGQAALASWLPWTGATDDTPAAAAWPDSPQQGLEAMRRRLMGNAYFAGMRTLLHLWLFRTGAMLLWLPGLAAGMAAVVVDAWSQRAVRRRTIRADRPERYTFYVLATVLASWYALAAAGSPWPVPLLMPPSVLACIGVLAAQAWAWHHAPRM